MPASWPPAPCVCFLPPPAFLPGHQLQHEPPPTRCCGCRARFACSAACCCIVGWPRFETNTWPPPRLPSGPPATPVQPEASHLTDRSEEHTSELQSLMRISYAVFCLKKKNHNPNHTVTFM